jgi:hypothetical protein
VGEANAFSSAASVLAPLAVAAGLTVGIGWRPGYLLPIVALVPILLMTRSLPEPPRGDVAVVPGDGGFGHRWLDVLLAVSVEFCMVFWAGTALLTWDGLGRTGAAVGASAFLLGMALGRAAAAPAMRLVGTTRGLVIAGCAVAGAGFALFWITRAPYAAAVGLLVTGAGVALLYPATVTRAIAARPGAPDVAAARCAIASGLAIGGAPLLLARVADTTGLRIAYLLVPILLAALIAHVSWRVA